MINALFLELKFDIGFMINYIHIYRENKSVIFICLIGYVNLTAVTYSAPYPKNKYVF